MSILSNPTTMARADVAALKDLGADIFTVALDAATPEIFDRTRGKGVQSPHSWAHYWEILMAAREIFGPQKFGAHIIVGMGETEYDVLSLVQKLVDLGGHSHLFCFFPEKGSLMDHLPATAARPVAPRAARAVPDRLSGRPGRTMAFDGTGPGRGFGVADAELDTIVDAGIRSAPPAARASRATTSRPATGPTAIRRPATSQLPVPARRPRPQDDQTPAAHREKA